MNYQPGTWLSGWDTLHPEFNLPLYFKRIFWGVWQEHQGLGAVAAQAHAAELPRVFIAVVLSWFLPVNFLRYAYFFLTLFIGPLGMYAFASRVLFPLLPRLWRSSLATIAGLFYLLNLVVLQHYYVPFEMFATHYATLPWLLLLATVYLSNGKVKTLLSFVIVTIFASSMAHTPTLFYAYVLALFLFVGTLSFLRGYKVMFRALLILFCTIAVNSFWLLPHFYQVVQHGSAVTSSKIHMQFSEKAFLSGKKFGDLKHTILLQNFLFDWGEYNHDRGAFVDLFDEWKKHLASLPIQGIGWGISFAILAGLFFSFFEKRRLGIALFLILLPSFFAIANDLSVSEKLFAFLAAHVPLAKEALRFPFTKFSILLLFPLTCYFVWSIEYLARAIVRVIPHERQAMIGLLALIAGILIIFMFPAFRGNLISPSMKVKIPEDYFNLFDWLKRHGGNGRVAHLPVHTFWGWVYYRWHYEGAGFLWFGVPQPLVDREFDRWGSQNENAYWELSDAVYSRDMTALERVLEKYDIRWLVLDTSIINPSSAKNVYIEQIQTLLAQSEKISRTTSFGPIGLYAVHPITTIDPTVRFVRHLPAILPAYQWSQDDRAFEDYGAYVIDGMDATIYPFRSLFTGSANDPGFSIEENNNSFIFEASVDLPPNRYYLDIPSIDLPELQWVNEKDLSEVLEPTKDVYFDGKRVRVTVPKLDGRFSGSVDAAASMDLLNRTPCEHQNRGQTATETVQAEGTSLLRITAHDATNCTATFWFPDLPHDLSYLIQVETRNIQGQSTLFWFENLNARRRDIEMYLPKRDVLSISRVIQPPMERFGLGYAVHLDTISIGDDVSINDIGRVSIHPIPYKFLTQLKLLPYTSGSEKTTPESFFLSDPASFIVEHPNPSMYAIHVVAEKEELVDNTTLILSQAFEDGWQAYKVNARHKTQSATLNTLLAPLIGERIREHVLVSNWANGWKVGEIGGEDILVIQFLPQWLEFLGLAIAAVTLGSVVIASRKQLKA